MPVKNNITHLLDSHKTNYTIFRTSEEKISAEGAAHFLVVSPTLIYKTIVVKRKKGKPILAVISEESNVNLKALAKLLGEKKVFLTTQADAEKLTGLQTSEISSLALVNKGFDVVLDSSTREHEQIHVSAGQRGFSIRLSVDDLIKLTRAQVGKIRNEYETKHENFFA